MKLFKIAAEVAMTETRCLVVAARDGAEIEAVRKEIAYWVGTYNAALCFKCGKNSLGVVLDTETDMSVKDITDRVHARPKPDVEVFLDLDGVRRLRAPESFKSLELTLLGMKQDYKDQVADVHTAEAYLTEEKSKQERLEERIAALEERIAEMQSEEV